MTADFLYLICFCVGVATGSACVRGFSLGLD